MSAAVSNSLKAYLKEMLACDDDKDRIGLLPFRHSQWINRRIRDQCTMEKPSKEKMYARGPRSCLFAPSLR